MNLSKNVIKTSECLLGMATGNNRGQMVVMEEGGGVQVIYQHKRTKQILCMGCSDKKETEGFILALKNAIENGEFIYG